MLSVDRNNPEPYYQQIYRQIASQIEEGVYRAGERLPSLRHNALALNVSRNTVEQAYQLLTQEGYVDAHPGSGYTVNWHEVKPQRPVDFDENYQSTLLRLCERTRGQDRPSSIKYNFAYDAMDENVFPYTLWMRTTRDVLQGPNAKDICRYTSPQGLLSLRQQISEYLIREQDIRAVPEQMLILPNTYTAVSTILRLFDPRSMPVTVENPGFPDVANACKHQGFEVTPHNVYPTGSWDQFVEQNKGPRLVFTTPSNQYPTNASMTLQDRKTLVDWAKENDAYLIEDAYCHEFRYGLAHPPSLHAVDTAGRVVTMGTFSKSLTPSLSLSYAVLPPQLMMRWLDEDSPLHAPVSWQVQATVSEFMSSGHWYQHLHKIQTVCRNKYRTLIEAVENTMGDKVEYLDYENGLNILLTTRDGRSATELLEKALRAGVRLYPTHQDFIGGAPTDWRYLLVGYAGISLDKIRPGIEALARAWGF